MNFAQEEEDKTWKINDFQYLKVPGSTYNIYFSQNRTNCEQREQIVNFAQEEEEDKTWKVNDFLYLKVHGYLYLYFSSIKHEVKRVN